VVYAANFSGRKIISVVSVLIRAGLMRPYGINIVEVHPPSHLNTKSDHAEWLKWADSTGIANWMKYDNNIQ
jgi:hypothetical protein